MSKHMASYGADQRWPRKGGSPPAVRITLCQDHNRLEFESLTTRAQQRTEEWRLRSCPSIYVFEWNLLCIVVLCAMVVLAVDMVVEWQGCSIGLLPSNWDRRATLAISDSACAEAPDQAKFEAELRQFPVSQAHSLFVLSF